MYAGIDEFIMTVCMYIIIKILYISVRIVLYQKFKLVLLKEFYLNPLQHIYTFILLYRSVKNPIKLTKFQILFMHSKYIGAVLLLCCLHWAVNKTLYAVKG